MPFHYELTWISHAKRWRKRYRGKTYYLKTNVNGRKDRDGYLSAIAEWERLKNFIDGMGPNPYTATGVLMPQGRELEAVGGVATAVQSIGVAEALPLNDDPPWILGRGLAAMIHPELLVPRTANKPSQERSLSALAAKYSQAKRTAAERGDISLNQYDEDRRQVETFRTFVEVNYPALVSVDQISPEILNQYRDRMTETAGSKLTIKKRLGGVKKFFGWLIDSNVLRESPKDLSNYARVRLDAPTPQFFTAEEVKSIIQNAPPLLKACCLLALNVGFTQVDCSTLTASMIDFETGTLKRDRNKTGVSQEAKLWPETLETLKAVGNFTGPRLLLSAKGQQLVSEAVNVTSGKVVKVDCVQKAWKAAFKTTFGDKTFKHLRKTTANLIEGWDSRLTGLFLAHAESGVKRHYVNRQGYDELFKLTDRARAEVYKMPFACD